MIFSGEVLHLAKLTVLEIVATKFVERSLDSGTEEKGRSAWFSEVYGFGPSRGRSKDIILW